MTWVVTWSPSTNAELARIASARPDPATVDQAVLFTDYILRRYPLDMGEPRGGADRLWYGDVIGVYYRIDDRATTVTILAAMPARRR